MSNPRPPLSPEVRALLDRERSIAPVPAPARARMLARAHAALIAGRVTPPSGFPPAPRARFGAALAVACIASAAVATTAYELGAHRGSVASERPSGLPVAVAPVAAISTAPPAPVATAAVVPSSSLPPPATPTRSRSSQVDPGPDELALLRQARSAVARHDYAAALPPIAEHARRFRNGRLAEEREALRVKALSGLGRTEEAQRAADAFETRFPRSVLLPTVSRMPTEP